MGRSISPLRFPGGKTSLYPVVASILQSNGLKRRHYAEPFAGGCGLALALLYGGHVSDIHINDIDASIWAFWHSVLHHTEEVVDKIAHTPITLEEWQRQRAIYLLQDCEDSLALGFSAFFLNRTNRSGIINGAGVIGGLSQNGPYKMDCRFNRDELIRRIQRVAKYRRRIKLTRQDAIEFVAEASEQLPATTFFCIDPPYFCKGADLYLNYYKRENHLSLASMVLELKNPWIVTYDNDPAIAQMYIGRRQFEFDISYSVETKRIGTELMIASKGLRIPAEIRQRQVRRSQGIAA